MEKRNGNLKNLYLEKSFDEWNVQCDRMTPTHQDFLMDCAAVYNSLSCLFLSLWQPVIKVIKSNQKVIKDGVKIFNIKVKCPFIVS